MEPNQQVESEYNNSADQNAQHEHNVSEDSAADSVIGTAVAVERSDTNNDSSNTRIENDPLLSTEWTDVTHMFKDACSQLELGELLHDSTFGLFEAMSAIEMMDPKMDAGMLCNQIQREVYTLDQAVQNGTVKLKDITASELIAIIDDTLACLVTWLEGHSLAQTVFTNLYLHNPYIIEDTTLKAFSICMLKIVDYVRDCVNKAAVFEEEDFQLMTYGFRLGSDVTDLRVIGMMKEAEEEINRHIKTIKTRASSLHDADKIELTLQNAVLARIRFCRLFFSTLLALAKEKGQGVGDVQRYVPQLIEFLNVMTATIDKGVQVDDDAKDDHSPIQHVMGFDPFVNQRLLPPTFPRYTQIFTRHKTFVYLDGLLPRIKYLTAVTQLAGLHAIMDFFHEFSKTRPCVLSRSLLQLLVLPQPHRLFGNQAMTDVLKDTIKAFDMPPIFANKALLSNHTQGRRMVDEFLSLASRNVYSIIQITGHNRARQRDKWAALLEDMANLQADADKTDAYIHSMVMKNDHTRPHRAYLGTWVLYHTLTAMVHFLLAGLELELYAVHEYHYIFWYLHECLHSWLISTLSQAEGFVVDQEQSIEQQQKGRSNKKNKKKKKTKPHTKEIAHAQTMQNLCGGYYKLITGLTIDNKLKQPQFEFDKEEVRYNHRFAPFGNLFTPPPVHYSHFKEMSDVTRYEQPATSDYQYDGACRFFYQARAHLETAQFPTNEMQTLTKIAKTNYVVAKLLKDGHKKDSQKPPEFDFSLHPVFPVVKLV